VKNIGKTAASAAAYLIIVCHLIENIVEIEVVLLNVLCQINFISIFNIVTFLFKIAL
jgi:hypothetical protein